MTEQLLMRLRRATWLAIAAAACTALAAGVTHAAGGLLPWVALGVVSVDALAFGAFTAFLLDRGSSPAASPPPAWRGRHDQLAAARHLVERYGEDSIAPFIVRPDKAYAFAAGGVVAYRVFGRTAVVSGDPVGPAGAAPVVLDSFMETARSRRWEVVVYGASANQLETYHRLGLRSVCVGEEAVAGPAAFSLEGRRVRKLRQSVHRMQRRGWQISVHDGVEIDPDTEAEINELEARWRARHPRMHGFAMSMGRFESGVAPADLYVLARSPEGRLAATMRFIPHRGKLSLDTMRRVGETPNGLNEALVCRALEVARERGISEVSLNYAGLAHLIRRPARGGWVRRRAIKLGLSVLGRGFQMERLVCFNEKFSPDWRPRYLVYASPRSLPRAVYRVLQAEGYISQPRNSPHPPVAAASLRPRPSVLSVRADAPGR
jgi:lysyl-tRNA synthetase, class II